MAFAAPVSAERLPPNPLADGWQAMASDGSWVSSGCLGEFSAPKCIAETVLACSLFTAEGEAARGRAAIAEDAAWIGGLHPLCDVLRRQAGNAGERDVIYFRGPRAGRLLFYRLLTVDLYAASCLEHCRELHDVQAVIAREQEQDGWRIAGWYLGTPGMDWAYLHGLYEGLWYDLGQ